MGNFSTLGDLNLYLLGWWLYQLEMSCFFLCHLQMGQWHAADEYDGQVREITFRSLCNSPMCPPDTAMTEYQHAVLSPDKKMLVLMHISSLYCGVNSVWVYELYLLIKKGYVTSSLSLLWSTYLSLLVKVLASYFSFSTSSWVP